MSSVTTQPDELAAFASSATRHRLRDKRRKRSRGRSHDRCGPVTTTPGSIGEAASDGVNGIVVRPGSSGQIDEAMTVVVADENLRAGLGTAARGPAIDFGLECWYHRLARPWTDLASAVCRVEHVIDRWLSSWSRAEYLALQLDTAPESSRPSRANTMGA